MIKVLEWLPTSLKGKIQLLRSPKRTYMVAVRISLWYHLHFPSLPLLQSDKSLSVHQTKLCFLSLGSFCTVGLVYSVLPSDVSRTNNLTQVPAKYHLFNDAYQGTLFNIAAFSRFPRIQSAPCPFLLLFLLSKELATFIDMYILIIYCLSLL
jgi:hypothetical protein